MIRFVFFLILGILIADFILERVLDLLNSRSRTPDLPEELRDVYDAGQYRKQQEYKKVNDRFGLLTSSFSFFVILLMLFLGGFQLVDSWARSVTNHPVLQVLVFFGILGLASDLLNTTFNLYDTFVIEEKFGFNKTTLKTYLLDKVKGWLLGIVIGGGLLSMVVWFY